MGGRVHFLPPFDAYGRSFLYLLYMLIKLYYTKALSDPAGLWPWIEFVSSEGQESWCLIVQKQHFRIKFRIHLREWEGHKMGKLLNVRQITRLNQVSYINCTEELKSKK